ncbi:MAG: BrnA antitoxin family protein [Chloroflexota bacterium]|nr:BrnA antitoxin family protein [Chloroflexota bacterium]
MSEEFDRTSRYPTEAHGSIPAFRSTEEEAEFYDTHDFTDFWHEGEPVRIRHAKNKSMQIRWDDEADKELQRLADIRHIPKSTLARAWLLERLEQERKQQAS